jgi:hypothetical protein
MKECGFTMLIRSSDKFAEWVDDILKFCNKEETGSRIVELLEVRDGK